MFISLIYSYITLEDQEKQKKHTKKETLTFHSMPKFKTVCN